jgi:acyl-CoA thioesterase FadM
MHCADASTIQVMTDRKSGRAIRIPAELRETLQRAKES